MLTPANRPPLAHDPNEKMAPFGFRVEVLQDDTVRYVNQPIALVIAETLEAATEGAAAARAAIRGRARPHRARRAASASRPPAVGVGAPPRTAYGDLDAGFRRGRRGSSRPTT